MNRGGIKRKLADKEVSVEDESSSSNESDDEFSESDKESDETSDEDQMDDSLTSDEDESSIGEIDDVENNITLEDISDDEDANNVVDSETPTDQAKELFFEVANENDDSVHKHEHVYEVRNDTEPVKTTPSNMAQFDEYDYDSSDEEDVLNTIGNIPYEWYKDYVHIGYDVDGRKIIKPPNQSEVDSFLDKMENPDYWRTVKDNLTGQKVILSDQDVDLVKRIKNAKCPDAGYNFYEPFIDFFSYEKMIHPATNRPEPKAAFIPSLSEKRIVSKMVAAIKKARLRPKPTIKKPRQFEFSYDLWEKDGEINKKLERYIPAPKPRPPGHEESYNPPPEYLFTEEEEKEWLEQEPEERRINFVPKSYSSLRQVPAYSNLIKERFERSLDLYLCPRVRKNRIQINPEDLIPQLPKPSDLQPFPSVQSIIYQGHEANVNQISVQPSGQFMVSGDNNGVLKFWEIITGRCFKSVQFSGPICCVCWCPIKDKDILAIVIEKEVYMINCGLAGKQSLNRTDEYFKGLVPEAEEVHEDRKPEISVCDWMKINNDQEHLEEWNKGVRVIIKHKFEIGQLSWHSAGEYFSVVMPQGQNKSVVIHHLTKMKSQVPFKRIKDIIQHVRFHPTKAYFFVATKRSIRIYDLIKQQMSKKLSTNCNEISCIAIHPGGDNLIVASLDPRVQWFDLDLSDKPYKTMRYHSKAVRYVDYHRKYPLFASSSDDGTVVICHGMVYDDLLQNALIVPVKVLKAKDGNVKKNYKIPQCLFHPNRPWIFAITDNTVRLFS